MADVTRLSGAEALEQADEWWADPQDQAITDTYTDQAGLESLESLAYTLGELRAALDLTDTVVPNAARYLGDHLDLENLTGTVVMVQDLRRQMGVLEAYLAREAGILSRELDRDTVTLPDGRVAQVRKGKARKGWDHTEWKRAVRQAVVRAHTEDLPDTVVDPGTGEELDVRPLLHLAVSDAQEVHGSTAPRTTALKALGIDPGDYCEESPGPWTIQATTPTTTIQENEK